MRSCNRDGLRGAPRNGVSLAEDQEELKGRDGFPLQQPQSRRRRRSHDAFGIDAVLCRGSRAAAARIVADDTEAPFRLQRTCHVTEA